MMYFLGGFFAGAIGTSILLINTIKYFKVAKSGPRVKHHHHSMEEEVIKIDGEDSTKDV